MKKMMRPKNPWTPDPDLPGPGFDPELPFPAPKEWRCFYPIEPLLGGGEI